MRGGTPPPGARKNKKEEKGIFRLSENWGIQKGETLLTRGPQVKLRKKQAAGRRRRGKKKKTRSRKREIRRGIGGGGTS